MKMVMIMSIFHGLSKDPLLNMGPLAVLLKPCFSRKVIFRQHLILNMIICKEFFISKRTIQSSISINLGIYFAEIHRDI